jgi:hypothetical protein
VAAGFIIAMIASNKYSKVNLNLKVRAFIMESEVVNYEMGLELSNDGNQN